MRVRTDFNRNLGVWLAETVIEAAGTGLVICVLPMLDAGRYNSNLTVHDILAGTVAVLWVFGLTGYMLTSAIAALGARLRGPWQYPFWATVLYFLHSSLLFKLAGKSLLQRPALDLQAGGMLLTLVCTFLGTRWFRGTVAHRR